MRTPVILSAEDNPANRRIIRDLFGRNGFLVREACDGLEAIEMVRRERPDLVLLDIQLPKLPGYDVARAIKADRELCHIPIVAVTSYALSGDDERAFEAGCDDYVSKPFRPRVLLEKVRALLDREVEEKR